MKNKALQWSGLVVAAVVLPATLWAQGVKLVEAAKKEGGKVVVYGSLENDTMDLIASALKKRRGWKQSTGEPQPTKSPIGSPVSPEVVSRCSMSC
jgi:hypothetical protein